MAIKRNVLELLSFLSCCNLVSFKHILFSKVLQKALAEIAYNLLYSKLPLTDEERRSLKRIRNHLRKLSTKKVSPKRLKKALSRGIASKVLKPALRLLNGPKIHFGTHGMGSEHEAESD